MAPRPNSAQHSSRGMYPVPMRNIVPIGYSRDSHSPSPATAMNISPASTFLRTSALSRGCSMPVRGPSLGMALSALGRNDRQQEERLPVAAGVDGVGPGIVVGVIMHVALAADAVAGADVELQAVSAPEHHRRRPDLDVDLHDLAGLQILPPRVPVVGPIGQRQRGVELPVR